MVEAKKLFVRQQRIQLWRSSLPINKTQRPEGLGFALSADPRLREHLSIEAFGFKYTSVWLPQSHPVAKEPTATHRQHEDPAFSPHQPRRALGSNLGPQGPPLLLQPRY